MSNLRTQDWLLLTGALILVGAGVLAIGVATGANIDAANNRYQFEASGAAARAATVVTEPTPIWIDALNKSAPPPASSLALAPLPATPPAGEVVPAASGPSAPVPTIVSTSAQSQAWSSVAPRQATFVFLDPPEPGARARISVSVSTAGPQPGGVVLAFPLSWLDAYQLVGSSPAAAYGARGGGYRRVVFTNVPVGDSMLLVDVVSTSDGIGAPVLRVESPGGRVTAEARLQTAAPKPNPGPVSALRIPNLGLNVAVVPTAWEPPPFVVGQLKSSANVMQGNTVVVGHLTGAAGAVFNKLEALSPGDTVVAVSRGVEYSFTVSEKQVRPADDSEPVAPDDRPRLTLMTCFGTWDPFAHTYSDRLWVIAEPPDLASATIAADAANPGVPTRVPLNPDAEMAARDVAALDNSGLGAERAALDAKWGAPVGETPAKLVVYRQGSAEYHVRYTPDTARAELISMQPVELGATSTFTTALQRARAMFPVDSAPRTAGPEGSPTFVVERFSSAALATAVGQSDRGGEPGDFVALYSRDANGEIVNVVVGAGDNRDAISAAARP